MHCVQICILAPLFFDSTPCGCEADGWAFCNFDYGSTGFCESCEGFSSAWDCNNDGLPYAGAQDCIARCEENFSELGISVNLFGIRINIWNLLIYEFLIKLSVYYPILHVAQNIFLYFTKQSSHVANGYNWFIDFVLRKV